MIWRDFGGTGESLISLHYNEKTEDGTPKGVQSSVFMTIESSQSVFSIVYGVS